MVDQHKAANLSEFIAIVEKLRTKAGRELWFRGHSQEKYKLDPSLFRNPSLTAMQEILNVEKDMISEFKFRYLSY